MQAAAEPAPTKRCENEIIAITVNSRVKQGKQRQQRYQQCESSPRLPGGDSFSLRLLCS